MTLHTDLGIPMGIGDVAGKQYACSKEASLDLQFTRAKTSGVAMGMGKSPRLAHLLSRDEARGTSLMVSCKKKARRLLSWRRDD